MDIDENAPGNISQNDAANGTDSEAGFDPRQGQGKQPRAQDPRESGVDSPPGEESEIPLPPDDDAPIDEEMPDVDANNSVSSDHPPAR